MFANPLGKYLCEIVIASSALLFWPAFAHAQNAPQSSSVNSSATAPSQADLRALSDFVPAFLLFPMATLRCMCGMSEALPTTSRPSTAPFLLPLILVRCL